MKTQFKALVKSFNRKALVSGDTGYEVKLQCEEYAMTDLAQAPSDAYVTITVEWEDKK